MHYCEFYVPTVKRIGDIMLRACNNSGGGAACGEVTVDDEVIARREWHRT
jgi:hypothetical protein